MYPSLREQRARAPATRQGSRPTAGVARTVVLLGITSLFTDVSSEMVAAVLPLYLVLQLGFTPLQFGIVDGLYEGDTEKLGQAFHEGSHLYWMEGGAVSDWPRAKWLEVIKGRPSAKSKGLKRTDRIVSIDLSGPETAFVKLECSIHPRYFTDYLTLLKLKGGWQVVSKTFRADVRE